MSASTPPIARRHARSGHAMLEFALAFSFLFPLFFGAFQFGYSFFLYNQLKNAIREGARYASLATYDSNNSNYTTAFGAAVQNMVVYGDPAGNGTSIVPGLTSSNVALDVTFANGIPAQITVSIRNYSLDAVFTTFVLNKPSCTFPYTGRYAPAGL